MSSPYVLIALLMAIVALLVFNIMLTVRIQLQCRKMRAQRDEIVALSAEADVTLDASKRVLAMLIAMYRLTRNG
jgi:hypothetical protein